ncbi:hypothetical protein RhiirC2_861334 [Rhizophagus irregularis]|uniref:Uncharacterized protein n=1 Tax=Rhizophagus irregularis TaxID=588596 RepID=A0A2N1NWV1_9GLOM|nr:hypothetical protein RhiirC2_861334 [Rhizophagus irregularis]
MTSYCGVRKEIKEKKEKEKEEEHWILSWRPEFLRMEIDGAMIPVATPWDGMAVSTFKTVNEVDNDFRANAHEDTTMADSIKCGVEIERQGNHDDLVRSIEFGKESSTLAVRELCRNEYMIPSSVTDTRVTNQNLCDNNKKSKTDSVLRELQNDHETQNTHDLASLIRLLKDKEPYRDETNKDVLFDYEIQFFAETYGITDFLLVFACGDLVFWLEDHGVIYFWFRIDDSMIRGGENLKEALTNYLFNQENLCYVDEITRKLVPINAYDKEAEELVKPPEACNNIDVTKAEKISVNIYFDLLDQSIKDYKLNHGLSYLLTEKIREYGWVDMDFKDKEILHQYSKKVGEEDWKNFSDINLKIKDFPNGIRTKCYSEKEYVLQEWSRAPVTERKKPSNLDTNIDTCMEDTEVKENEAKEKEKEWWSSKDSLERDVKFKQFARCVDKIKARRFFPFETNAVNSSQNDIDNWGGGQKGNPWPTIILEAASSETLRHAIDKQCLKFCQIASLQQNPNTTRFEAIEEVRCVFLQLSDRIWFCIFKWTRK